MTAERALVIALLLTACTVEQQPSPPPPPPPPECESPFDCPHNVRCVEGHCFSEGVRCGDDGNDCGALYECDSTFCGGIEQGHCVVPDGAECCSLFDCGEYEGCLDFRCDDAFCGSDNDCRFMFGLTDERCDESDDCANGGCVDISPAVCTDFSGSCCDGGTGRDGCNVLPVFAADGEITVACVVEGDCINGQCVWANGRPPPGGRHF